MRSLRASLLRLCLFVACVALCAPLSAYASDVVVLLDGKPVARGLLIGGTVYLPVRATAEALGLSVSWDTATRVVSLSTAAAGAGPPIAATPATPAPVAPAAIIPPTPPRAFNADLQKRALAFLELRFPPPNSPMRPQLVSPPQPVLPPPVYIPPVPVKPTRGNVGESYVYGQEKAGHDMAETMERIRQMKAARILADYQRECDVATARYQQALADYEKELREFDAYSLLRSQTLAAANLVAAAACTPVEPDSWQTLSNVLDQVSASPALMSEESKVAAELARLAAQEALLPPSAAPSPAPTSP